VRRGPTRWRPYCVIVEVIFVRSGNRFKDLRNPRTIKPSFSPPSYRLLFKTGTTLGPCPQPPEAFCREFSFPSRQGEVTVFFEIFFPCRRAFFPRKNLSPRRSRSPVPPPPPLFRVFQEGPLGQNAPRINRGFFLRKIFPSIP